MYKTRKHGTLAVMNLREAWASMTPGGKQAFAKACGTSYTYISQCTGSGPGARHLSVKLCRRMIAADPRLTLEELRPDVWGSVPPKPRRVRGASSQQAV